MDYLKIHYVFFFCLINFINTHAQFPGWAWLRNIDNPYAQGSTGHNYHIDKKGNMYVYGAYSGTQFTLNGMTVNNSDVTGNSWDVFLAKYDNEANPLWMVSFGLPQGDENPGQVGISNSTVGVDGSDNIYIHTFFNGLYTKFGSIVLTNPNFQNLEGVKYSGILAKISANGQVIWAKTSTTNTNSASIPTHLTVRPDGKLYVFHRRLHNYYPYTVTSSIDYGNGVVVPQLGIDSTSYTTITLHDNNGNALWARPIKREIINTYFSIDPVDIDQEPTAAITHPDGSLLYMYGNTANYGSHIVIKKINISGNTIYANPIVQFPTLLTPGPIFSPSLLKCDVMGNSYISGVLTSPTNPTVDADAVVYKIDNSGNVSSNFQIVTDGVSDGIAGIGITGTDSIVLAGVFSGQAVVFPNEVLFNSNGVGVVPDYYMAYRAGNQFNWQNIISPQDEGIQLLETDLYKNVYAIIGIPDNSTLSNLNITCPGPTTNPCFYYGKIGDLGAGINALKNNGYTLFPNPSNGTFTIQNIQGNPQRIEIFNTTGSLVYEYTSYKSDQKIETGLRSGVYYVNVYSDNTKHTTKAIIVN